MNRQWCHTAGTANVISHFVAVEAERMLAITQGFYLSVYLNRLLGFLRSGLVASAPCGDLWDHQEYIDPSAVLLPIIRLLRISVVGPPFWYNAGPTTLIEPNLQLLSLAKTCLEENKKVKRWRNKK